MSRIDEEVRFLKNLKKRFSSRSEYLLALKDMTNEGMITQIAYNRIVEEDISPRRKTDTKTRKISPAPSSVLIDPCRIPNPSYSGCCHNNRSRC